MAIIVERFTIKKDNIFEIDEDFIRITFNPDSLEPENVYLTEDQVKSLIESLSNIVF